MQNKQTRRGYADALVELGEEMPELVVLDADVSKGTKTCDFEKAFPNRFSIAEHRNKICFGGCRPGAGRFCSFASTFGVVATCRAGDQLRNSIAYPKANVKIAATHCGSSTGGDGASHQANEDIAIARSFPNMTVLVPGDYEEAKLATKAAAKFVGPVYPRFGRDTYPVVEALHGSFVIGKAKVLRHGSDVTIVSTGIMAGEDLEAAAILEGRGYSALVIHMPTVKPFDGATLLAAARQT